MRQNNTSQVLQVDRSVGSRGDRYELIACTDASRDMYGTVLYLHNLTNGKISFVTAKNRIVTSKLASKTIPSLELQAVLLGTKSLIDLYQDLSGDLCVDPIKIEKLTLFTDSLVTLNWIHSHLLKFNKNNKLSVFVLNRLSEIHKLSQIKAIIFKFVTG